jgi:hypothetical protein
LYARLKSICPLWFWFRQIPLFWRTLNLDNAPKKGSGRRLFCLPSIARLSIPAFRAGDPGPNPGRSTTLYGKPLLCINSNTVFLKESAKARLLCRLFLVLHVWARRAVLRLALDSCLPVDYLLQSGDLHDGFEDFLAVFQSVVRRC